jgi:hypothetical protein
MVAIRVPGLWSKPEQSPSQCLMAGITYHKEIMMRS